MAELISEGVFGSRKADERPAPTKNTVRSRGGIGDGTV